MTGPRQSAVETYFRDSSALFGAAYGRPINADTRDAMMRMHNRAKGSRFPLLRKISDVSLKVLAQSRPGRCAFIDLSLFRPTSPQPSNGDPA